MKTIKPCLIEGCANPAGVPGSARGLCRAHYLKWHKRGTTDAMKASPGAGCVKDGYRFITVNGKQVREHRYVAEQILGRPIRDDEHIHHIDHNKLNNSPNNLEIVTAHEHGLRHATFRSETHKECARCHIIKPRRQFHLESVKKPEHDPHRAWCIECRRASEREHGHDKWLRQKARRQSM